jgi:hypothetical protein
MSFRNIVISLLLLCSFFSAQRLNAQELAINASLGSLGAGAGIVVGLSESVHLRAGGNFFAISHQWQGYSTEDFSLSTDIKLRSAMLLADWYPAPASTSFRISGGLILNMNSFSGTLTPRNTYTFGGDVYTPEDLGDVDVDFSFPLLAPFISTGFGSALSGSRLGVHTEVGVFYQQSPKVSFTAEGYLKPTESQAPVMQNNLSWANLYPVFTVSVYYRL